MSQIIVPIAWTIEGLSTDLEDNYDFLCTDLFNFPQIIRIVSIQNLSEILLVNLLKGNFYFS